MFQCIEELKFQVSNNDCNFGYIQVELTSGQHQIYIEIVFPGNYDSSKQWENIQNVVTCDGLHFIPRNS